MRKIHLLVFLLNLLTLNTFAQEKFAFKNTDLPIEQRVNDLVSRMTIDEKISQLMEIDCGKTVAYPARATPCKDSFHQLY